MTYYESCLLEINRQTKEAVKKFKKQTIEKDGVDRYKEGMDADKDYYLKNMSQYKGKLAPKDFKGKYRMLAKSTTNEFKEDDNDTMAKAANHIIGKIAARYHKELTK